MKELQQKLDEQTNQIKSIVCLETIYALFINDLSSAARAAHNQHQTTRSTYWKFNCRTSPSTMRCDLWCVLTYTSISSLLDQSSTARRTICLRSRTSKYPGECLQALDVSVRLGWPEKAAQTIRSFHSRENTRFRRNETSTGQGHSVRASLNANSHRNMVGPVDLEKKPIFSIRFTPTKSS